MQDGFCPGEITFSHGHLHVLHGDKPLLQRLLLFLHHQHRKFQPNALDHKAQRVEYMKAQTLRHCLKSLRLRLPETERGCCLFLSFPVSASPCTALFLSAACALLRFCTSLNLAISALQPPLPKNPRKKAKKKNTNLYLRGLCFKWA